MKFLRDLTVTALLKPNHPCRVDIFSFGLFFVLGLNLPRSLSLLTFVLVVGLCLVGSELRLLIAAPYIVFSAVMLFAFGLSFSIREFQLGFWAWNGHSIKDFFAFTFLPAASLITAYLARHKLFTCRLVTLAIVGFMLGGLCYVLLALGISRDPWWNWSEVFAYTVKVPWGEYLKSAENVRSVEQRAFPALIAASCLPLLIVQRPRHWRIRSLLFVLVSLLASYALRALNGRLQFMALALSFMPFILLIKRRYVRWALVAFVVGFLSTAQRNLWICDERYSMQFEFLRHISSAPWGGRQISYMFEGCPGQGEILFAPPPHLIHLPHNIFLDVVNDVGIVPASFLMFACSILLVLLIRGFIACGIAGLWRADVALRFGMISVVVIQSLFQPLLYSDRSLFVVSFLLTGALLAEFSLQSMSETLKA